MKSPVHIVWRSPAPGKSPMWMILYESGETSRIKSAMQAGIIGIALSLGRVVVVHRKDGEVDYTLQPEVRSQFHAMMFVAAASFLTIIIGVVWLVIWLTRQILM